VSYLDRWWDSTGRISVRGAFFRTDLVCTADGGAPWEGAGVVHGGSPAVLASECDPGSHRVEYESDIAFVGSWQHGYHAEWTHRPELIRFLRDRYGDRVRFWPRPGEHAVRGPDLRDLYASVDVVVGDSCLVPYKDGRPAERYCSDRVPNARSRSRVPPSRVVGVVDDDDLDLGPNSGGPLWTVDRHLCGWDVGDWDD
jgi:hypothetical protein